MAFNRKKTLSCFHTEKGSLSKALKVKVILTNGSRVWPVNHLYLQMQLLNSWFSEVLRLCL